MSDNELSSDEEARLQDLLQRAATGLSVEMPEGIDGLIDNLGEPSNLAGPTNPASHGTARSRMPLLAAAAIVIVVAIGAGWWSLRDGPQRVATTPDDQQAHPRPDTHEDLGLKESKREFLINSEALAPGGVWRLPNEPGAFEVEGAETIPLTVGFQVAVDDVDDPTRWFAVMTSYNGSFGEQELVTDTVELGDSMVATRLRFDPTVEVTDSSWIRLTQGDHLGALVFAYRGVSDDEAMSIVREVASAISDLDQPELVRPALLQLKVPEHLIPTWPRARVGLPDFDELSTRTLILALRDPATGHNLGVRLSYSGLSSAVARLEQTLNPFAFPTADLPGNEPAVVTGEPWEIELQPGMMKSKRNADESLTAFTEDGVGITVFAVDDWNTSSTSSEYKSTSIADQLKVLNSLRPIPEAEFRSKMAAAGVELTE